MYADLDVDGQIIRIINNHLQTTNINQVGGNPLGSINQPTKVMRMREMMNENGVIRARQADRIRVMVDESPYPLIVCGDFNDTPASYTYRKIKGDLEDSFLAAGKGYGYTYRYLRKLLRIDYLFYSPGVFRATRYYSPDLEYSDHKPVIVSLDVTPAPVEPEE
jgi:endonuclease/exonuclease/phosphatase (EEP) superfamily protein YafD